MSDTLSLVIALAVLALVIVLVWLFRRSASRQERKPVASEARIHPKTEDTNSIEYLRKAGIYWGVSLQVQEGRDCCTRAGAIQGQELPLDRAVNLPLKGCDQAACFCYYQPLTEHRAGRRRVTPDRRNISRYEPDKKDRRQLPGRRAKDCLKGH